MIGALRIIANAGRQILDGGAVVLSALSAKPRRSSEAADGTVLTTTSGTINASQTPGSASSGPFDVFALATATGGSMTAVNMVLNTNLAGLTNTLPATWSTGLRGGVTNTFAYGTDATTGLPYLDWTLGGTAPTAGTIFLFFSGNTTIPVSANGAYVFGFNIQIMSGTLAGSGITVCGCHMNSMDSGGNYINNNSGQITPTTTMTAVSSLKTMEANAVYCQPSFDMTVGTTPLAITFRIMAMQMQTGSTPPTTATFQPTPITNYGVSRNGVIDTTTPGMTSLTYTGHTVYRGNGARYWWWTGTTWTYNGTGVGVESVDGTDITSVGPALNASPTPGSAGTGNILSISSGGQILLNGVVLGGSGVIELYYTNHTAYQFNGTSWYAPITASGTGSNVASPKGGAAIAYSTGANPGTNPTNNGFPVPLPLSTMNQVGSAVSPLGWTIDLFDDFKGTFTRGHSASWNNDNLAGSTNMFTTGATWNGNPVQYGAWWNKAMYGNSIDTDSLNNVSMDNTGNGLLTFNVTASGGQITSAACVVGVQSVWGYWEWSFKATQAANGTRSGTELNIWFSGYQWPVTGELDVIETAVGAARTTGGYCSNIHISTNPGTDGAHNAVFQSATLPGSHTWDDGNFHVFGTLFTPSYIAGYCDGTLIGWTNSTTYLNNLTTTTDPPYGTAAGSFGYLNNQFVTSPSHLSSSGISYQTIFGYEVDGSCTTAACPMSMNLDWWRHSKLYPASGGPHV